MKTRSKLRLAVAAFLLIGVSAALLFLARERAWFAPPVPAGVATVRLISAEQYEQAMHDLFGGDIEADLDLPPLPARQGLAALSASRASITPGALERFDRTARHVAEQVVDEAHRATLVPCVPANERAHDDVCATQFFARIGHLLYRRPLTDSELRFQVEHARVATRTRGDFYGGVAESLAAMLISPKFLYIAEATEPDPRQPGGVRLDASARASRLSLFFWNALPDAELLRAAEAGELYEARGLDRQIERLMRSPRLEQGVWAFFSDMLAFSKFETLVKDAAVYPLFTRATARSSREQARRLIAAQLIERDGDYRDLFTTADTFIDATLAPLYRAPAPDRQWTPVELDPARSAGLLTSLSFLTLHSHPGRTSPTLRGKALRELLLCQKVPDPPPNVNFSVFEDPEQHFKTARERLQAHATDPVCAGCHTLTDPMGLALENFDGAGAFRSSENGVAIDTHGTLDGRPFTDVAGLGRAVHDHRALGSCLTSRLYAYGLGREVGPADRPWLAYLAKRFAVNDYRVPALLREIARSDAFFAISGTQARGS